ncbi:AAA family ATPase, partial [Acinetobacter baumannii]
RNSPVVMTSQLIDQIPEIDWLIEGLLPQIGVAALASDPNAGKTLAYLDVASRVALGKALCGREVMQGTTLVVAAEGHVGLHARVLAIAKAH